jgi:hypothetical protein
MSLGTSLIGFKRLYDFVEHNLFIEMKQSKMILTEKEKAGIIFKKDVAGMVFQEFLFIMKLPITELPISMGKHYKTTNLFKIKKASI